jgi:hypothetical protein
MPLPANHACNFSNVDNAGKCEANATVPGGLMGGIQLAVRVVVVVGQATNRRRDSAFPRSKEMRLPSIGEYHHAAIAL